MEATNEVQDIFPVRIEKRGSRSAPSVSIYALHRPDKQWAILAIDKDPRRWARLEVKFKLAGKPVTFADKCDVIQFARQHYAWQDGAQTGHVLRSMPPSVLRFFVPPP